MGKLSKRETKLHNEAIEILKQDILSAKDKETVLRQYRPDADHNVSETGTFFTPLDLAGDMMVMSNCGTGSVIDLCAGIGGLAYWHAARYVNKPERIFCVERNPRFVEIGKKIVPEAEWICADVFDVLDMDLGRFRLAISNPPFGALKRHGGNAPRYTGKKFDLHVVDIAAHIADMGTFIIPPNSTNFRYSGRRNHEYCEEREYLKFKEQTGITFSCESIDADYYRDEWQGTSPAVEVAHVDFTCSEYYHTKPIAGQEPEPAQMALFA